MTFGQEQKQKTDKPNKKPLSILGILGLIIVVVLGFYFQETSHEDIITSLKGEVKTLATGTSSDHHAHNNHHILSDHVDKDILDWAYKKARNHVPKEHVAVALYHAQQFPNYLMMVSLIAEESAFDTYAKSNKGARGLPQIMWDIWGDTLIEAGILNEKIDLFDAQYSIPACDYILKDYRQKYGDWSTVLFRYVNGDRDYVMRVLSNFAELTLIMSEKEVTINGPNPSNNQG